ncbi:MAG: ATP-binding protein [Gemmatimonadota bacterium]|nr:ATP-binding protein [Gemmatimonadota bacterium]
MTPRRSVIGWVTWVGLLLLATIVLFQAREDIDLSYAVLTMILIVLGGSAAGGRGLGFTLAVVSFILIDYYFQRPYNLFSVNKPLDAVVLLAFLAAAGVATDLLARAQQEAEAARQRASEVESLSHLGAATLRHARPADALDALAVLVRETIGASACSIFRWDGVTATIAKRSVHSETEPPDAEPERQAAREAIASAADATIGTTVLAVPLSAEDRIIGALAVRGDPMLVLEGARRRYLAALSYYAALGLERVRLYEEAAHSEALREANRAKDQILASVSHDLRTPLTTIKVLAQAAESRGDPSATAIVEQADRLARMVRDLLELSRIRAGSSPVIPELNTAEDLVGAALRQTQGVLDGRTVDPHIDLDSPVLVGLFDFVHTLRILGNLIDNAIRYSPPGGVVDLVVRREDSHLVFIVADRGAGVPGAERERIFDAFYRPTGSTPDTGHAGLGLSIARTLAELQGGTLTYSIREGGGSEFTLRLPAADVDEPAIESSGIEELA